MAYSESPLNDVQSVASMAVSHIEPPREWDWKPLYIAQNHYSDLPRPSEYTTSRLFSDTTSPRQLDDILKQANETSFSDFHLYNPITGLARFTADSTECELQRPGPEVELNPQIGQDATFVDIPNIGLTDSIIGGHPLTSKDISFRTEFGSREVTTPSELTGSGFLTSITSQSPSNSDPQTRESLGLGISINFQEVLDDPLVIIIERKPRKGKTSESPGVKTFVFKSYIEAWNDMDQQLRRKFHDPAFNWGNWTIQRTDGINFGGLSDFLDYVVSYHPVSPRLYLVRRDV